MAIHEQPSAWRREICLGLDEENPHGSATPPLFQTSLFSKRDLGELVRGLGSEHLEYMYTRGRNPTVEVFESKMARLERGESATCFRSGMAAISAVMLGLLKQGDHVLFVNHIYGPTLQLAEHLRNFGISYDWIRSGDRVEIESLIRPQTRMLYFESPGTLLFDQVSIPDLVELSQNHDLYSVIDNSWATPLFQKPLELGVDIVLHSCSKYLGGA